MGNTTITYLKPEVLLFDTKNPRMAQYDKTSDENKILNDLWDNMAVNEIVMSILANGFFQNEPMYAIKSPFQEDKYIVIEGNRRLAAVRAILSPELIKSKGMQKYTKNITKELKDRINEGLPVVVLQSREESWRLIGFKHVNGAAKWDSFAKATYIAYIHNEHNVPLAEIAEQIGDNNNTTLKLYQSLMVLKQAEARTQFSRSDIYKKKLSFSYIFSALGYTSVQEYISLRRDENLAEPIPDDRLKNLEQLLLWLYGSKGRDIRPIINSQTKDLSMLNKALTSKKSIDTLLATNDLDISYQNSFTDIEILRDSLIKAKSHFEKILSKISSYNGDRNSLEYALELAEDADTVFSTMKRKYNEINGITTKRSID